MKDSTKMNNMQKFCSHKFVYVICCLLFGWLVGCLFVCLVGWLVSWLVGWLVVVVGVVVVVWLFVG